MCDDPDNPEVKTECSVVMEEACETVLEEQCRYFDQDIMVYDEAMMVSMWL